MAGVQRRQVRIGQFLTALVALLILLLPRPAMADNVINVTINDQASVYDNPCAPPLGEPVAVSGAIHIVITTTLDGAGGYHTTINSNEAFSGQGLVSGTTYRGTNMHEYSFYAGAPFPVVNTNDMSTSLISQGGSTQNYQFSYDIHVTINSNGVPTASVDNLRMKCTG